MQRHSISRRRFLKSSAAIAAGSALPAWFIEQSRSYAATTKPLAPNDKPHIALIGCGGQGRYDTTLAAKFAGVVAVCDVDSKHAEEASKQFDGAKAYKDFRKLLERDDVHAIINGTPDHWHTLVNIAAMKAGKDVYSEKPLTLTIDEGKRLVAVARETGRILQTGSQQRSDSRFRLACELVRDFWQGQTPSVPYVRERCHGSFRYWWEYSGGTMTDWGAHHNDIALWGMGLERSGPVTVQGRPLIEMIPGGFTASAEYRVEYSYANGVTHTCQSTTGNGPDGSVRGTPKPGEMPHGIKFEGAGGWIFVTRGKLEASNPALLTEPLSAAAPRLYASDNHMGNFFDCIRSRQQPICDAEIGHRSVSVCHLGVISIRLGRKLNWDPAREHFVNDSAADKWLVREQRKPWTYDLA